MAAPENTTICVVASYETVDRHGFDVCVVVAKVTYEIAASGKVRLAAQPSPIRTKPEFTGDKPWASERFPSDVIDEKPGTDVLFVGTAHPLQPGATSVDVRLCVGALDKTVRVHGARVWQRSFRGGVTPGPAAALSPTPLVYERAFGGRDDSNPDAPLVDEHNPVGTGIARDPATLIDQPAPVIEDPKTGRAAGLGPVRADWEPRRSFAGTCDEAWARSRAPILPVDYDPRHACCAPDDQWSATPLIGNEPVEIIGATPEGVWRFRLPRYEPRFELGDRTLPTHLDTFLVDGDTRRAELTWRTSIRLPNRLPVRITSDYDEAFYEIAGETLVELAGKA